MAKAWEGCVAMGTVKKKVRPGKAPETAALTGIELSNHWQQLVTPERGAQQ